MARGKPNTLRVIFLDIDGVLNSDTTHTERHHDPREFAPIHVDTLNRIIELTGAVLVVSSVWRLSRSVARLQCILNKQGVKGTVLDRTSRIMHSFKRDDAPERPKGHYVLADYRYEQAKRGEEIQEWLDDWKALHPGEKMVFVILDDDRDMLHLMDRLVWTGAMDCTPGLLPEHVEPVVKILKGVTW
jgi:hypothetical protein